MKSNQIPDDSFGEGLMIMLDNETENAPCTYSSTRSERFHLDGEARKASKRCAAFDMSETMFVPLGAATEGSVPVIKSNSKILQAESGDSIQKSDAPVSSKPNAGESLDDAGAKLELKRNAVELGYLETGANELKRASKRIAALRNTDEGWQRASVRSTAQNCDEVARTSACNFPREFESQSKRGERECTDASTQHTHSKRFGSSAICPSVKPELYDMKISTYQTHSQAVLQSIKKIQESDVHDTRRDSLVDDVFGFGKAYAQRDIPTPKCPTTPQAVEEMDDAAKWPFIRIGESFKVTIPFKSSTPVGSSEILHIKSKNHAGVRIKIRHPDQPHHETIAEIDTFYWNQEDNTVHCLRCANCIAAWPWATKDELHCHCKYASDLLEPQPLQKTRMGNFVHQTDEELHIYVRVPRERKDRSRCNAWLKGLPNGDNSLALKCMIIRMSVIESYDSKKRTKRVHLGCVRLAGKNARVAEKRAQATSLTQVLGGLASKTTTGNRKAVTTRKNARCTPRGKTGSTCASEAQHELKCQYPNEMIVQVLDGIEREPHPENVHEDLAYAFKAPVSSNMYPTYLNVIDKPISLKCMRDKATSFRTYTINEFTDDLNLLAMNASVFYGEDHAMSKNAAMLRKLAFDKLESARINEDHGLVATISSKEICATSKDGKSKSLSSFAQVGSRLRRRAQLDKPLVSSYPQEKNKPPIQGVCPRATTEKRIGSRKQVTFIKGGTASVRPKQLAVSKSEFSIERFRRIKSPSLIHGSTRKRQETKRKRSLSTAECQTKSISIDNGKIKQGAPSNVSSKHRRLASKQKRASNYKEQNSSTAKSLKFQYQAKAKSLQHDSGVDMPKLCKTTGMLEQHGKSSIAHDLEKAHLQMGHQNVSESHPDDDKCDVKCEDHQRPESSFRKDCHGAKCIFDEESLELSYSFLSSHSERDPAPHQIPFADDRSFLPESNSHAEHLLIPSTLHLHESSLHKDASEEQSHAGLLNDHCGVTCEPSMKGSDSDNLQYDSENCWNFHYSPDIDEMEETGFLNCHKNAHVQDSIPMRALPFESGLHEEYQALRAATTLQGDTVESLARSCLPYEDPFYFLSVQDLEDLKDDERTESRLQSDFSPHLLNKIVKFEEGPLFRCYSQGGYAYCLLKSIIGKNPTFQQLAASAGITCTCGESGIKDCRYREVALLNPSFHMRYRDKSLPDGSIISLGASPLTHPIHVVASRPENISTIAKAWKLTAEQILEINPGIGDTCKILPVGLKINLPQITMNIRKNELDVDTPCASLVLRDEYTTVEEVMSSLSNNVLDIYFRNLRPAVNVTPGKDACMDLESVDISTLAMSEGAELERMVVENISPFQSPAKSCSYVNELKVDNDMLFG